jgi:hypothetical protein
MLGTWPILSKRETGELIKNYMSSSSKGCLYRLCAPIISFWSRTGLGNIGHDAVFLGSMELTTVQI